MKWNAFLLYFLSRHRLPHLCSTHASSFIHCSSSIHCSSFIPCLAQSFITTGDHKKTSLSILFISISWVDAKRQTEANDMREEETKGASFSQLSLTRVFVSLSKLCLSFKEEVKYLSMFYLRFLLTLKTVTGCLPLRPPVLCTCSGALVKKYEFQAPDEVQPKGLASQSSLCSSFSASSLPSS